MTTRAALISKYKIPKWKNGINQDSWIATVQRAYGRFGHKDGISLYIHLPFFESLCTYCGCDKRITKNLQVENPIYPPK